MSCTASFTAPLQAELDRWQELQQPATFWWRDDDAIDTTDELERLLDLTVPTGVPLCLAVIPMLAHERLFDRLRACPGAVVLVHGVRHSNHAPEGAWRAELGLHRPLPEIVQELSLARQRLAQLAGPLFRPVLVAPWHVLAPEVEDELPGIGISGLSSFGPRGEPSPGQRRLNAHVNIIDWDRRSLRQPEQLVAELVSHLSCRRQALTGLPPALHMAAGLAEAMPVIDPHEPTGLLTHHKVHDQQTESFLAAVLACLGEHPAARWLSLDEAISLA